MNLILQAMAVQTRAGGRRLGRPRSSGSGIDAYRRDDARTQRLMARTAWVADCTSWYKSASGRVTNNWPTWTVRYWYDTLRLRPSDLGLVDDADADRRRRPGCPPSDRPTIAATATR